ncbi:transmembrane protein 235-like [Conger conger]|uniref:transmembrane protein 235-like n=1 Tax=Conger conger TaxID=82655 RepID=UPI002A5A8FB9|nr:transmembrane protein 235-like [Conger conger]
MNFGTVVVIAGFSGLFSFGFLAAAIGSDYWYIIKVNQENLTYSEDLDSHSGLWRINEGKNASSYFIHPFTEDTSDYTEPERHLLSMHKVIVILLPLSLVLLVFGGICSLVSSLAHSRTLLIASASYFLFCSLFTLSGVSIYISYSQQALQEIERQVGPELLARVHVSFGWSLGLAWLSYGLELTTAVLLLLAAHMTRLQQTSEFSTTMAMG